MLHALGDRYDPAMPDMTPEQIAEIQEYAEAFRSEWEINSVTKPDRATQRENIHTELDEVVPDALAGLKYIIKHGKNESLKFRAIIWLLDKKLEADKIENDPLTKLVEEMQKSVSPTKPDPTNNIA